MKVGRSLIMITIFVMVIFFLYVQDGKRFLRQDKILTNHVKFSGKIVFANVSDNHSFGIIGIKVHETNIQVFRDSVKSAIFPYKLCNGYAEFYGQVPIRHEIGLLVVLDSDERVLKVYDNGKLVGESDVTISSSARNMAFVRRSTMFRE